MIITVFYYIILVRNVKDLSAKTTPFSGWSSSLDPGLSFGLSTMVRTVITLAFYPIMSYNLSW